jgi:hypothetical protein
MRFIVGAFMAIAIASPACAQSGQVGTIASIRTGWNADSFAIVTVEPIANPAHCQTADGYIAEKSQPGYSTYYAAALTAYATSSKVAIIVDNTTCGFAGRPKLIGIDLIK